MSYKINQSAVTYTFRAPNGPCGRWLYSRGLRIESRAKQLCPVDTGRLRSSITTTAPQRRGNRLYVRVGSNVKYARYVHDGHPAYTVRPTRPGGVLRFQVRGQTVYSRYARIPARRGVPYLREALTEAA